MTAGKLARGSVKRTALAPDVLARLDVGGPPGPPGAAGPQGVAGPPGPGAAAIRFFAQASEALTPQTALDFGGLKMTGTCQRSGTTITLVFSVLSEQDAVLYDHFDVDTGTDPYAPGSVQSGNIQIDLPAGVEKALGGGGVAAPNFGRVMATVVYISGQSRIMTLTLVALLDAAAGTCLIGGTAVSGS